MKKISTIRELMFQISEINENTNAFEIARNLMGALQNDEINASQYEMLVNDFQRECIRYKVVVSNEICSLF